MKDVELVIKLPKEIYKDIMKMTMQHISGLRSGKSFLVEILKSIRTGIPLQKGHGRLIDADALNRKDVNCANVPMNFIDTAPTIIQEDKEESEE